MKKTKLKNGITLIFDKKPTNSLVVEIMFKVGSNYEGKELAGISHFLEHMLFEGTKKRKDSREIANEIEKYGGDFNAYTTGDRTAYFVKIINKKFDIALDILSDMIKNSIFNEKIMEKEKKVILKEINMVTDDPRLHQWIVFQKAIFEKHPAKNPTYGTAEAVKSFSRETLVSYFQKYYIPNNMIISIVGNVEDVVQKVNEYFGDMKPGKHVERKKVIEPQQKSLKKIIIKKRTLNSYMVLGYKTIPRLHKDSYVFDVMTAILGRGQSGWMFDEIRNKRGLAYQVGINNESEKDYGYFSVYTNLDKGNIPKAKEIIMQQFKRLKSMTENDLEEAKMFIEGNHTLQMEENVHHADYLAFWETIQDALLADFYMANIQKVSIDDIRRVVGQYLNDKYTMAVIEQE